MKCQKLSIELIIPILRFGRGGLRYPTTIRMNSFSLKRNKVSVGILARLFELPTVIDDLIPSLSWSDDIIIVVDSLPGKSRIRCPRKVRVFFKKLDRDYASQRNFLLTKSKNDWVFFIDPDERCSREIIKEIAKKIDQKKYQGLLIRREESFLGGTLKYGEGSVWILRIGNKKYGRWQGKVHERWVIKPKFVGAIETRIAHFGYNEGIRGFLKKNLDYAYIRAEAIASQRGGSLTLLVLKPIFKFCQNYFWRGGFLDGKLGLMHAFCMSFYSLSTEMLIFEKSAQKSD